MNPAQARSYVGKITRDQDADVGARPFDDAQGKRAVPLLDRIGNTPLLPLTQVTREVSHVQIWAKAEWMNPGGSVKDRPAYRMILEGEQGRGGGTPPLRPGKTILDATSGNTGIAYAMIGAIKGYPVKLAIPANVSVERKRALQAYGAQLVLTDPRQSSDGAIVEAKKIYEQNPELYFFPDQYNNNANWQAHYDTTGPEIWTQTQGQVTHLVAGLGTSGTLMGTGRRLKEYNPRIQIIAVEPDAPFHGLEGLKNMASAIVPGIYDPEFPDTHEYVNTEESYAMVLRLAREEGILAGPSSGAALVAAMKLARDLAHGFIVVIFPDGGGRYLSERFWEI